MVVGRQTQHPGEGSRRQRTQVDVVHKKQTKGGKKENRRVKGPIRVVLKGPRGPHEERKKKKKKKRPIN